MQSGQQGYWLAESIVAEKAISRLGVGSVIATHGVIAPMCLSPLLPHPAVSQGIPFRTGISADSAIDLIGFTG
jgi:hypothetical protein